MPSRSLATLLLLATLLILQPSQGHENVSASPMPDQADNLWSQLPGTGYANTSQDFQTVLDTYDIFIADDFQNTVPWSITTIQIPGMMRQKSTNALPKADSLTWAIFSDDNGKPAGTPTGLTSGNPYSGSAPFWTLTLPPNDAHIEFSQFSPNIYAVTTLYLNQPINLPAGHWWLVFYPKMSYVAPDLNIFLWQSSGIAGSTAPPILQVAKVANPREGLQVSPTWVDVNAPKYIGLGIDTKDFAFSLSSEILNRHAYFPLVMR